jgi:type VI secretion system Hcp family effector
MPIFLKLDTIKGDAGTTDHVGEIEISSLSYGLSRPVPTGSQGGGYELGPASVTEVTMTKKHDRASLPLTRALLTGSGVGTAQIKFATAPADGRSIDYLVIEMLDASVTSVTTSSDGGPPFEQVAFTARQMRWIDQPLGAQAVSLTYDLTTGKPL